MRNNTPDIDEIHSCYSCYDCSKKDRIQCGEKNKLEQLIAKEVKNAVMTAEHNLDVYWNKQVAKERLEAEYDLLCNIISCETYARQDIYIKENIIILQTKLDKLNHPTENNLGTVDGGEK